LEVEPSVTFLNLPLTPEACSNQDWGMERCSDNRMETCINQVWASVENCTASNATCMSASYATGCVIDSKQACTPLNEGATRCLGHALESCSAGVWVLRTDCKALSGICLEEGASARCDGEIAPSNGEIAVSYLQFSGPDETQCVGIQNEGILCQMPTIDMENLGLGQRGVVPIRIHNLSECPAADDCEDCSVTLHQIQITETGGSASVFDVPQQGNTEVVIPRADESCGQSGSTTIEVQALASTATELGQQSAKLSLHSNDPARPEIEIPLLANFNEAPDCVAGFRAQDPLNPMAPFTRPDDILAGTTVYLDGSSSTDTGGAPVATYTWDISVYPEGFDPIAVSDQGQGTAFYGFDVPLPGYYEIRLRCTDGMGTQGGLSEGSLVRFEILGGEDLVVEMSWETPGSDHDVHLSYTDENAAVCNQPWDCHFGNPRPQWFTDSARGQGPNPLLEQDVGVGPGVESIRIQAPRPGTYRVYSHYFSSTPVSAPSEVSIRVIKGGTLLESAKRLLTGDARIWAALDVVITADSVTVVEPFPADSPEIGAVRLMPTCSQPGFDFE
jgi:hypothetical protein